MKLSKYLLASILLLSCTFSAISQEMDPDEHRETPVWLYVLSATRLDVTVTTVEGKPLYHITKNDIKDNNNLLAVVISEKPFMSWESVEEGVVSRERISEKEFLLLTQVTQYKLKYDVAKGVGGRAREVIEIYDIQGKRIFIVTARGVTLGDGYTMVASLRMKNP